MKNSLGNGCTQGCDWKSEFKISFWRNTAAILEDVDDICVYQHSDDTVDVCMCLSAHKGYW
jgi:hypothetical protein